MNISSCQQHDQKIEHRLQSKSFDVDGRHRYKHIMPEVFYSLMALVPETIGMTYLATRSLAHHYRIQGICINSSMQRFSKNSEVISHCHNHHVQGYPPQVIRRAAVAIDEIQPPSF